VTEGEYHGTGLPGVGLEVGEVFEELDRLSRSRNRLNWDVRMRNA
jgi:hypothetical protein